MHFSNQNALLKAGKWMIVIAVITSCGILWLQQSKPDSGEFVNQVSAIQDLAPLSEISASAKDITNLTSPAGNTLQPAAHSRSRTGLCTFLPIDGGRWRGTP